MEKRDKRYEDTAAHENIVDKALLYPEDEKIANAEVGYGRDHDDRFIDHKRGGRAHECKGPQCEDSDLKP